MGAKNGLGAAVARFVAENPGATSQQIAAALGTDVSNGAMTYLTRCGIVFVSGKRNPWHYYATAELAKEHHEKHVASARAESDERRAATQRAGNIRRRARCHAKGGKTINTRPGIQIVTLDRDVRIAPDVKITIAKRCLAGRFDPEPGFERAISSDWFMRRQGIDIPSRIFPPANSTRQEPA